MCLLVRNDAPRAREQGAEWQPGARGRLLPELKGGGSTVARRQRLAEYGLTALLVQALVFCGSPWGVGDVVLAIGSAFSLGVLFAWQVSGYASKWEWSAWSFVALVGALALSQLLPLPPSVWAALDGREMIVRDLATAGLADAWRPLGLDPAGAFRSIASLLPALVILLGVRELSPGGLTRVAHWLVMLASVSALLGLAQVAGGPDSALRLHEFHNWEGALGFFANRNHQAALLYMCLPIAFALASGTIVGNASFGPMTIRRFLAILAIPVLLLGLVLTTSRAGTALGMVAMFAGLALAFSPPHPARRRHVVLLTLVVAVGLGMAMLESVPVLSQRLEQDILGDSRWWLFASTWELRTRYGWWGSGLGSFEEVFRQLPENQVVVGAYVNHAHNDWLELWLELGWLFPIVALVACAAFVRACWHAWRNPGDVPLTFALAAMCSVVLVALHSLVDWPLRTGANMAVFSFLAAILLRCGKAGREFPVARNAPPGPIGNGE